MPGRLRRRAGPLAPVNDEGPFVSFTDLFIGILFLFLIQNPQKRSLLSYKTKIKML